MSSLGSLFQYQRFADYWGVGEADAGERGAIVYTLIERCRRRGQDPYAYLRDVLRRLPNTTNRQSQRSPQKPGAKPVLNSSPNPS